MPPSLLLCSCNGPGTLPLAISILVLKSLFMSDALHIFTDGSFDDASKSGGWAFVVHEAGHQVHSASGRTVGISNNTFEVLAVLNALSWIAAEAPTRAVTLWTDAVHVIEGCHRYRAIWRNNGWKRITPNQRTRRRPIPDRNIWQQLDSLLERHPHVVVEWCKGHSGTVGNEYADALARGVSHATVI
ncbi:Ribonuclease H [Agrobacterium deltaense RV3]|nr:Ribonuclease H [Agrobacterium deltaense RV3]